MKKFLIPLLLLVILIVLALATPAQAVTVCGVGCDYTDIQTALNGGHGEVYIKAGSYTISQNLQVPSDILIRGDGKATHIRNTNTVSGRDVFTLEGESGVIIRDLFVETAVFTYDNSSDGNGIQVSNCDDVIIQNIWAKNGIDGISVEQRSTNVMIENANVVDTEHGIALSEVDHVQVRGAIVTGESYSTQRGVAIWHSNAVIVSDVEVTGARETGIFVRVAGDWPNTSNIVGVNINNVQVRDPELILKMGIRVEAGVMGTLHHIRNVLITNAYVESFLDNPNTVAFSAHSTGGATIRNVVLSNSILRSTAWTTWSSPGGVSNLSYSNLVELLE